MEQKGGKNATYSSPDDHSTRHFFDTFIGHLEDYTLFLDFLNHRLGQDVNLGFLEGRFGVVNECLAERGQHGWKSLDKGDLHPTGELGIPEFEILVQKVVKLATVRGN